MKTIKELEAFKSLTDGGKGYWRALEDVLGLIDETSVRDGIHYRKPWEILEELKARITG